MLHTTQLRGEGRLRRWLWPYAILAVALSLLGLMGLLYAAFGLGTERIGARVATTSAVAIEPMMRVLISALDMVAPFELPGWLKNLYAILVIIAGAGLVVSGVMGLVLLPVFYALYRTRDH
jgi:integral membrane sensor domain MASE1